MITIETAIDLGQAVKARLIKTDAVCYPDGGFGSPRKTIEFNSEVAGMKVETNTRDKAILTITGKHCWSYGGVGNCYEMLNPDGTLNGWWSLAHVRPVK